MAKDNKKLLLEAQEIKLVKILAGNNKKLRERTLKRLNKWLIDRSNAAPLTEEALMKIWKGLFYAMWMSDKPLIQEDCAEKISNLIHLNDTKSSLLFFKCFLQTMLNEWFGIDNYRTDKFLMLTRRVFRQVFEVLHRENWSREFIVVFTEILNQTVLKIDKNTALGLCLHVDDLYLEELAKISKGQISSDNILLLIQPFAQQLSRADDKRTLQHITNHIFKYLINQTDIAIDYKEKFQAWRRQGFPGGNIDALEAILVENDDFVEDEDLGELGNGPLDPRAGKIDVVLPQLQFDPLEVANLLEGLKFKKYTTSNGRKTITKLVKHFKILSEGVYPYGLTQIKPLGDVKTSVKNSVKSLVNFEENLARDSKKSQKKSLKRKKAQEALLKQIKTNDTEQPPVKKQKTAETIEEFIQNSEGHLFPQKQSKKQNTITVTPKKPNNKKIPRLTPEMIPIKSQNHFKRNSGVWTVDEFEIPESPKGGKSPSEWEKPLKDGETEIFVVSKKSKKKLKRLAEGKNRPMAQIVEEFTQKIMNGSQKRTTIVKNPFSENLTPKSEKKIKFSNKIQSQEFKDHQQNIIKSPVIPYDGTKRPVKSLLKPSPFSSPINPFYKLNNK